MKNKPAVFCLWSRFKSPLKIAFYNICALAFKTPRSLTQLKLLRLNFSFGAFHCNISRTRIFYYCPLEGARDLIQVSFSTFALIRRPHLHPKLISLVFRLTRNECESHLFCVTGRPRAERYLLTKHAIRFLFLDLITRAPAQQRQIKAELKRFVLLAQFLLLTSDQWAVWFVFCIRRMKLLLQQWKALLSLKS